MKFKTYKLQIYSQMLYETLYCRLRIPNMEILVKMKHTKTNN